MGTGEIIALAFVKYGPGVARQIVEIFRKEGIQVSDWEAVFARAEKSYDDYVKPLPTPAAP